MYGLKATIIFCLTAIGIFLGHLFFQSYFSAPDIWIADNEKGIYVFDKKTRVFQFCSTEVECTKIDFVDLNKIPEKNNKIVASKTPKSKKGDKKDTEENIREEKGAEN